MTLKTSVLALFVVVFPLSASADEAGYRASDIVNFFTSNKDQGATRGICVGTEDECAKTQDKQEPLSFDLLINFEKDSAELSEAAKANLTEFSGALKDPRLAVARFSVEGYTDASGTEAHNLGLSERRAQSVIVFLGNLGVDTTKLIAKGMGESRPRTADAFDPTNRRVETRMIIQ